MARWGLVGKMFGVLRGNAEQQQARRNAKQARRLWGDLYRWPVVSMDDVTHSWLAAGEVSKQISNRFDHPSWLGPLGREGVVNASIQGFDTLSTENCLPDAAMVPHWARVDSPAFWARIAQRWAAKRLDDDVAQAAQRGIWLTALEDGAKVGNLQPFLHAPKALIQYQAADIEGAHPRVALWLANEGYASHTALNASVNEDTFPLKTICFSSAILGEPMTTEFVAEWCILLLRDYGLNTEQKIRVAGQAMLAFGFDVWEEHIEPVCAPYMEGIDISLVRAVCGDVEGNVAASSLHRLVALVAAEVQRTGNGLDQTLSQAQRTFNHTGLSILASLNEPRNLVDLYFLANQAQSMDIHRTGPIETLALPALS